MKCPHCDNILFITGYYQHDNIHILKQTCSVCRVIITMSRGRVLMSGNNNDMGFQLQDK